MRGPTAESQRNTQQALKFSLWTSLLSVGLVLTIAPSGTALPSETPPPATSLSEILPLNEALPETLPAELLHSGTVTVDAQNLTIPEFSGDLLQASELMSLTVASQGREQNAQPPDLNAIASVETLPSLASDLLEVRSDRIPEPAPSTINVAPLNNKNLISQTPPTPTAPTTPSTSPIPTSPALTSPDPTSSPSEPPSPANALDLTPEIIEGSPVLQRWLEEVPNVLSEINRDPSFRTRLRLGYSNFPSTDHASGFNVGIEDVFLGRTGLTVSGDYQATFEGDRTAFGGDLRYYVLPLGSYVNIAPTVGYRNLETVEYSTEGVNVGLRLLLALSRTGAADISFTQGWVSPGTNEEVGLSTLSFGYALTRNLRLSTDLQKQNARQSKDSRVGIVLEWML